MAASPEIREGFLCPICLQDFGEVLQLQNHFSDAHRTPEESDLLDTFKGDPLKRVQLVNYNYGWNLGFIGKAKEKLLSLPSDTGYQQSSGSKEGLNPFQDFEEEIPQEIGLR